jgi:hypothetical protein
MTKDYSVVLEDSTGRRAVLDIIGASVDEMGGDDQARANVEDNAFANAIAEGLIGADAWLVVDHPSSFLGRAVVYSGDVWKVIGVGAQRDGNTFCNLASLSRGRKRKNGFHPVQVSDWVDTAVLTAARHQA